jgi:predicted thioesterase
MTQHAKAIAVGDTVEVHIRLLTSPRQLETAVLVLTSGQAQLLSQQLAVEGVKAEFAKNEKP